MPNVTLNAPATILNGILAGKTGTVVEYYSIEDQVEIEVDDYTTVITSSENIEQ
ncbi:hypothetical protein [Paenibacillus sp. Soil724D2]|uniref:hypothetical protein n=1 Tax=Paenibacillus sp. (strain Soil724D2) TaxID=1736392 RepID=UPI000ADB5A5A|nr:hypothetical protein [Paenibacillus sp. Soil724D2]